MVKAILLDALGTLIGFENPAPHLQAELHRRGHDISREEAERAIRAEIAYYRAHLDEGRDPQSLHDLRVRCAAAMGLDLPAETALDALLASLRFYAYPDSAPALRALRERGIRLVVVSNWDWSLHERLSETGLTALLHGALSSAEVGAAKPDGAIFRAALEITGTRPEETWHVGDTPEADVEGARAAGIRPILVAREGAPGAAKTRPAGSLRWEIAQGAIVPASEVRSLSELIPLAAP
jgi:putative hydrolase of the HAD superfamily